MLERRHESDVSRQASHETERHLLVQMEYLEPFCDWSMSRVQESDVRQAWSQDCESVCQA